MYNLTRPLLFQLSPEFAHNLVFNLVRAAGPLGRQVAKVTYGPPKPALRTRIAGLDLAGPVGLAAGLDKDATLPLFWPTLGFGFVELGTVTALAQPGNPRPRLFRFPNHQVLINRMGFNNLGAAAMAERLGSLPRKNRSAPLGINLGKSKVVPLEKAAEDYATSASLVSPYADYLVINVSSPNTPGLRKLQDKGILPDILQAVSENAQGRPVFVKISPDLGTEALGDVVDIAERYDANGIIATNTTINHHDVADIGNGGLSGKLLAPRALEVVRHVAQRTQLPVIAVGGIDSVDGVLAAMAAGATAVQLYTGLIFRGPGLVHRLNRQLLQVMGERGCQNIDELRQSLSNTPQKA